MNGVVDQVAHHLSQQGGIALDTARALAWPRPLIAQVYPLLQGAGQRLLDGLCDHLNQVDPRHGQAAPAGFGPRQSQQLVDRVRGSHTGSANLLQRALELFGVGLALRQIGLHSQTRQWCLELMSRIRKKLGADTITTIRGLGYSLEDPEDRDSQD